jgi:Ser-tRNA(Ala) deacylase AlaX
LQTKDGSVKFVITGLKTQGDAILHQGKFEPEGSTFEVGADLDVHVDEEKRRWYARYHSAGHLLDMSMREAGQGHLRPSKGYHFTVGAYVEYIGTVDPNIKD